MPALQQTIPLAKVLEAAIRRRATVDRNSTSGSSTVIDSARIERDRVSVMPCQDAVFSCSLGREAPWNLSCRIGMHRGEPID